MKRSEIIAEIIKKHLVNELDEGEVIVLWNNYCNINYYDQSIRSMGDLDYILEGKSPTEILDSVVVDFNTIDAYFYEDDLGYFNSFNCITSGKSPIDFDGLAQYIFEYNLDEFIEEYLEDELDVEDDNDEEDSNYHLYVW